ncbi:MAG TPA: TolC family protein [Puia sp.]|nr:TolC family protein [Puia sp.]
MIRTSILSAYFLIVLMNASAQQPSKQTDGATGSDKTNSSINPLSNFGVAAVIDTAIENRLVELVLKGPEYDASVHQGKIAELELKRAKSTWLNLLTISTNYNDQSFAKPTTTNGQATYIYPKYFFGITIPLGIFFSQGNQVKAARESIANGKDQQQMLARSLKLQVLSKYKQYKFYAAQIEMENELSNDVVVNATQAEQTFRQGKITVDAYILAQRAKNEEMVKIMNLQLQQDLIRLDIERMIGVSLDSVVRPYSITAPASDNKSKR